MEQLSVIKVLEIAIKEVVIGNFEDDEDDIESSQESEQSSSKFPMTTSFIAIDGGTAAKHNGTL